MNNGEILKELTELIDTINSYSAKPKSTTEAVVLNWYYFKVCDGCDRLLYKNTVICPICKSLAFNESKEDVLACLPKQAEISQFDKL